MGNTVCQIRCITTAKDHPHIHGEYLSNFIWVVPVRGSPPHTWGILVEVIDQEAEFRITPTYMGNTIVMPSSRQSTKDHPHIHGEYRVLSLAMSPCAGSPPHTWGIHIAQMGKRLKLRITPTYMGNTSCAKFLDSFKEDHPHIHGEY